MLILFFFLFFLVILSMNFNNWVYYLLNFFFVCPLFFLLNLNNSFLSKNYFFCLDFYSFILLVLSFWIVIVSIMSSFSIYTFKNFIIFMISFMILIFFLFISFLINNLLLFFISFEVTLIPTLLIVIGWGYKVERLISSMYMFFYTLIGSFPMLVSIFLLKSLNNSLNFFFMENSNFMSIFYFFFIIAFLIKLPMFFVHSWLPKAHVEAPVSGSMILAGVLLKLGGYGIFRMMFFYKYFLNFNKVWLYLSMWGGVLSSLICLRQMDMKSLIAFSSVSHMSLVLISMMTNLDMSMFGSFMMMVSHGLCSSGLFFLVNLIYERSNSRSLYINKGLMTVLPSVSLWLFIFCSINMAAPPSLNLLSEIFMINLIMSWSFISIYFLMFLCFLSAVYSLFLFSFSSHGVTLSSLNSLSNCNLREFFICFLHFIPVLFLFLKMELFI